MSEIIAIFATVINLMAVKLTPVTLWLKTKTVHLFKMQNYTLFSIHQEK